jgi:lipoprotein NlpD
MPNMSRSTFVTFLLLFLLGACTSRYAAPVDNLDEVPRFVDDGRTHLVNDGETLYVVAWMYDLDFAALARHNNLREPYVVEPGQLLRVDVRNASGGAALAAAPAQATPVGTATTTAVAVGTGIQRAPLESRPITRQELPSSPPATTAPPTQGTVPITPPTTVTPTPAPAPATARVEPPVQQPAQEPAPQRSEPVTTIATAPAAPAVVEPAPQTAPASAPVDPNAPIQWDWPARGNIVGRFSDSDPDNKGIKLGGNEGDTVTAAADGEVVYTGNGLLRYGELVILKHNDRFLSAYAHNKVIAVKEGERVTRGQKIAELGSTGIDRDMLHFEIRLDGKPVDPMTYLPAR